MTHKKKRGRKKKRGPKKKKPIIQKTYVGLKRPYHIITTVNGVQLKDIHTCVSIEVAIDKLKEIQKKLNENVRFPVRYISSRKEKTFTEAHYKLVLIKKIEGEETIIGKTKNEYGKYIDCITNNNNWAFVDELPYEVEETFWVYGYNPKKQRKTYQFIFDNLITSKQENKYYVKQVVIFRNKLIISSVENIEMVICKNHADSVRLYNEIEGECKLKKMKYVTFSGDIKSKTLSFDIWFDKIQKLTNWTYRKINKNTTRD